MTGERANVNGNPIPQFGQAKACVQVGGFWNRRPIQVMVTAAPQVAVRPERGPATAFVVERSVYWPLTPVTVYGPPSVPPIAFRNVGDSPTPTGRRTDA